MHPYLSFLMSRMYLSARTFRWKDWAGVRYSMFQFFLVIWKMPDAYPPAHIIPGETSHKVIKMRF